MPKRIKNSSFIFCFYWFFEIQFIVRFEKSQKVRQSYNYLQKQHMKITHKKFLDCYKLKNFM